MIELYTWVTPNGRKISIMLEETGIPYNVHPVDLSNNEQYRPEFTTISPNRRIPAIVDTETGLSLMESGAILIYLARKAKKLLPSDELEKIRVIEWLMWQMGGFGPMLGQAHHFLHYRPDVSVYSSQRYRSESRRLYSVLDQRLEGRDFVVDAYSIADIAIWPWVARFEWQGISLDDFPNVKNWYRRIGARAAVQKGYHQPHFVSEIPGLGY